MKLVVGLGNPGSHYAQTRHNIGFMVVERLARELGRETLTWQQEPNHQALVAKVGEVFLVKPTTFVNSSGLAVKSLVDYYKLDSTDVWVIHDDIDLQLGKIRIRQSGASAGHHGVDSIISALKTDKFVRFRLGTGRGKESTGFNMDKKLHHRTVISLVLSRFRQSEAGEFKHLVKHATQAVQIGLMKGLDRATNRFN